MACTSSETHEEKAVAACEQCATRIANLLADLNRRVEVENILLTHYKNKTSPSPEECRRLAYILGIPEAYRPAQK